MSDLSQSQSQAKERPVGATILAILAGIAAVLAVIHALQFLGIFPFLVGPSGYTVHYYALARRTWSLDIPGSRYPLLSEHRLDSDDWSIHLAGCLLFYSLQWPHLAVLHATWRAVSFCHRVIRMCIGRTSRDKPNTHQHP